MLLMLLYHFLHTKMVWPPSTAVKVYTVPGLRLGRTWDFPTVNIKWPVTDPPSCGVYRGHSAETAQTAHFTCNVLHKMGSFGRLSLVWGPFLLFVDRYGVGEMHVLNKSIPELSVGSEIDI